MFLRKSIKPNQTKMAAAGSCMDSIPEPYYSIIERQLSLTAEDDISDYDLLVWCKSNELLKVVDEEIIDIIIPDKTAQTHYDVKSIKITDVKVHPPKKSKHMSDDQIYSEHPDIQSKIPRGIAFIVIEKGDMVYVEKIIQGLRKFTGLEAGDDDDVIDTMKESQTSQEFQTFGKVQYGISDDDDVVTIHKAEKANGENGHFGVIECPSCIAEIPEIPKYFFVGGSKAVHCVIRDIDDIDHEIYKKQRFTFASIIMKTCMEAITDVDQFCQFMSDHHLTLTIELLNPDTQHIVLLTNKKPIAKALTFLSIKNISQIQLGLNPIGSQYIARFFGFDPVEIEEIDIKNLDTALSESRFGADSEGYVFYGINSDGNVIHMYKRKTNWYVSLRAIRQRGIAFLIGMHKSLKTKSEIIKNGKKKVLCRIDEIQKWLKMSEEEVELYKNIGIRFIEYIAHKEYTKEEIRNKFPFILMEMALST